MIQGLYWLQWRGGGHDLGRVRGAMACEVVMVVIGLC